jgi:REP element-mobilizing transposase RayT
MEHRDLRSHKKRNTTETFMHIQHRINGQVYFITTTVVDWIDLFTRPVYKHIALESLNYCIQNKGIEIYAWVLMTNHLHLLAGITGQNSGSDIMRDFKKYTSKKLIDTLQHEVTESRREWMLDRFEFSGRNDKKIKNFRFWQEGTDIQEVFLNDYFEQKMEYIHNNPVKAEIVNLPHEYRYSSAIDYAGGKGLLPVVVV